MPCPQGKDRKSIDLETIGAHEIVCVDCFVGWEVHV